MNKLYEGNVGSYSFLMVDNNTIEVWLDTSTEYPESFIHLKEGTIKCEKDFQTEISYWYMHNVSASN
jgi:hypothetical protein